MLELNDIREALRDISMKLDHGSQWRSAVDVKLDHIIGQHKDHEQRIRSVERKQWYHTGGLAALAFLLNKLGLPINFTS